MSRGCRISGANGCQGALWSEELNRKTLRGALDGKRNLEPRGSPFSVHRLHGQDILLRRLQRGMLILKRSPCIAAMQYSSTSYDSVFFHAVCALMFRSCDFESASLLTRSWSLLSQQVLFFRGGSSPRTRAASYMRRVFDWG